MVGPEVTDCRQTTGPASPACTQMPLIADPEAGQRWLDDHPGVAVVSLEDASELARTYASGC